MDGAPIKYTFKKKERLNKKDDINSLFSDGTGFTLYPLKFIYLTGSETKINNPAIQVLITTPKKIHRKAVKRNLIKRRIREAYRKIKPSIITEEIFRTTNIKLGIIYVSKEILTYQEIEKKVLLGLKKLVIEVTRRDGFK